MIVLGADPGKKGGWAVVRKEGNAFSILHSSPLPFTFHTLKNGKKRSKLDPYALCQELTRLPCQPTFALIEEVGGRPGESASGAFAFGFDAGVLYGILSGYIANIHYVRPSVWKKELGVGTSYQHIEEAIRGLTHGLPETFFSKRGRFQDGQAEAALMAIWGLQHITF